MTPHCVLKPSYLFKSHFNLGFTFLEIANLPPFIKLAISKNVNFIMPDELLNETEHWESVSFLWLFSIHHRVADRQLLPLDS